MLGREGELILVNGQSVATMSARPAERERWRIVNACLARYLQLRLDSQRVPLLGLDSRRFAASGLTGNFGTFVRVAPLPRRIP